MTLTCRPQTLPVPDRYQVVTSDLRAAEDSLAQQAMQASKRLRRLRAVYYRDIKKEIEKEMETLHSFAWESEDDGEFRSPLNQRVADDEQPDPRHDLPLPTKEAIGVLAERFRTKLLGLPPAIPKPVGDMYKGGSS